MMSFNVTWQHAINQPTNREHGCKFDLATPFHRGVFERAFGPHNRWHGNLLSVACTTILPGRNQPAALGFMGLAWFANLNPIDQIGGIDAILFHAVGANQHGHSLIHQVDEFRLMFSVLIFILS